MGKAYSQGVTIILLLFRQLPSGSRSNILGTKFIIFNNGTSPDRKHLVPETDRLREELGVVCYVSVLGEERRKGKRKGRRENELMN